MTKKRLLKELEDIPDDMEIYVYCDDFRGLYEILEIDKNNIENQKPFVRLEADSWNNLYDI